MIRAPLFLLCACGLLTAQQYTISTLAGGNPPPTPAAAMNTAIGDPPRVAVDAAGNLYFPSLYAIFKVDRSGVLIRIAGTGRRGLSGDGGPALNAQLQSPVGIAVDTASNVYFTEREASLIRRIAPDGIITKYAGTGERGASGDGGPAIEATLDGPMGLTIDAAATLYVADTNNHVIRKITPTGTIDTVAGNGYAGYSGDGGPARNAHLNGPQGVAIDGAGNVYIADTLNHRVRVVSPDGTIQLFAANGFPGYGGDNGPAAGATLLLPTDVGVDRSGRVYIADLGNTRIREVLEGTISTFAGTNIGPQAIGVSSQPAKSVRLNGPTGLAVDAGGSVYFAEGSIGSGSGLAAGDYKVFRISPDGILAAVAGSGFKSFSGDFGPASRAQMNVPAGIAIDAAGNLYFADSQNHRVRKISPEGTITTLAGSGVPAFSGDSGPAVNASLNTPLGVAVDNSGNLYIADTGNHRVRVVLPNGVIGTVAGNGNGAFFGDGVRGFNASVHAPGGVAVDRDGNVYIADTQNHRIRKLDGGGVMSTVAGTGRMGFAGDGGPAAEATLNNPGAIAVDAEGSLYIADTGNGRIRKVTPEGTIRTIASSQEPSRPRSVTLDFAGNVYFADSVQNQVRKIAPDGSLTWVAGDGACCYSGDGGPAEAARLNAPWGAAADPAGNLYIADSGNNAIRQVLAGASATYIRSVANAASNTVGAVAPGEILVIHGAGLGPAELAQSQAGADGLYSKQLAGVTVRFNGTPGPLLYASAQQVSAVVPYGVTGSSVQVTVQYQSVTTAPFTVPLAEVAPALFTSSGSGFGQALALNEDGLRNGADRPAAAGSVVTLYATGEGHTRPAGVDGRAGTTPLPVPMLRVSVSIGGHEAIVESVTGVPGMVAGLLRIRGRIPAGVQGSAVPVEIAVGEVTGQAGVSIAVQAN